jgi:peptidoglycan/LPS O-acetylase OafA/YrhL
MDGLERNVGEPDGDGAVDWRVHQGAHPVSMTSLTGITTDAARVLELDGLRGLAALCVVVFHTNSRWMPGGWAAVDVFFGLSGFLITSILLKHGDSPRFLVRFYMRRGLRIWPIYYLCLVGFVLFNRKLPGRCNWSGLWYYLTYTHNIALYWSGPNPAFHRFLGHTWTLAIEEQFYILWPLLVVLLGLKRLPWLAALCVLVSVIARGRGWSGCLLLGRMDGLALGAMLAAFLHRDSLMRRRASPVLVAIVSLSVMMLATIAGKVGLGLPDNTPPWPGVTILGINLLAVGLIGLVVVHAGKRATAPLRWAPIAYLGRTSYGLYLYHYIILWILARHMRVAAPGNMPFPQIASALLLCFVVASLSWVFIEQPILRLKRHFEYQQARMSSFSTIARPESQPAATPRLSRSTQMP